MLLVLPTLGIGVVAPRLLTMHEAVLPQSAREMWLAGEFVVPMNAGRPWVENPPLPQWCVMTAMQLGQWSGLTQPTDWLVRIPSFIAGVLAVIFTVLLGSRLAGPRVGWLAGFMLGTMYKFAEYTWLAEDEIYLTPWVVLATLLFFLQAFRVDHATEKLAEANETRAIEHMTWRHFLLGWRGWATAGFFIVLGLTNLVKGIGFGMAIVLAPIFIWLALDALARWWAGQPQAQLKHWLWLPGVILTSLIALAWPVAAIWREPGALDVWWFDLAGRVTGDYTAINEPWWYYARHLPEITAPWILLLPLALILTGLAIANRLRDQQTGPFAHRLRHLSHSKWWVIFLLAVVPTAMFHLPSGKHHHYLLHITPAYALLTALAGHWLIARLHLKRRIRKIIFASIAILVFITYLSVHQFLFPATDQTGPDIELIQRVEQNSRESNIPIVVNADLNSMDFCRFLFYLPRETKAIHSLEFLHDNDAPRGKVLLITRQRDVPRLQQFGQVTQVDKSSYSRGERGEPYQEGFCVAAYLLEIREDLDRWEMPEVTPMQAMSRAPLTDAQLKNPNNAE